MTRHEYYYDFAQRHVISHSSCREMTSTHSCHRDKRSVSAEDDTKGAVCLSIIPVSEGSYDYRIRGFLTVKP